MRSHGWLYDQLLDGAQLDSSATLVETRREAEVIIYLSPPWPDPEAPDRLRRLRVPELRRLFVFSQSDFPVPWAPGMYASLPRARARSGLFGGFYVAPNHRGEDMLSEELDATQTLQPDLLWSFTGTLSNAPVRRRLAAIDDPEAVVRDTQHFSDVVRWKRDPTDPERREAHRTYAEMLGRSMFIACARGRGASSMRIFEAMQAGRCPVIISDEWLPPPFVRWQDCSISVPEAQVDELPSILRARQDEALTLGRNARATWDQYFGPERRLRTLIRAAAESVSTLDRCGALAAAFIQPGTARVALREARRRLATGLVAARRIKV